MVKALEKVNDLTTTEVLREVINTNFPAKLHLFKCALPDLSVITKKFQ